MDSLLNQALRCQATPRPPIWLMRQAGRYMPEYRALKERYTFLELCENPELAIKVTLMPMQAFQPDAAIVFADILLLLQTFGFTLGFGQDHGPLINSHGLLDHIDHLQPSPIRESLGYLAQTIKGLKEVLTTPLLGFCGAPFTLATYVLEKRGSQSFDQTKHWIYQKTDQLHTLLQLITDQTIDYLKMQIEAGVDAVQIFDSWAGFFSYLDLKSFAFPYLKQIIEAIKPLGVPIILFAKGSCSFLEEYVALEPSAISLDASADLLKAAHRIPSHIAIQGNLDPDFLHAPLHKIEAEANRLMQGMQNRPGYIFNLGHGIKPSTPVKAVDHLIQTVKNFHMSLST